MAESGAYGGGAGEHFDAIVIGECGMGKSTLTYNLAGRPQLDKNIDGMNALGVTKDFVPYPANLRGAGFMDKLFDTPGIGDSTINLMQWISMAEEYFTKVDAIIVCISETNPRVTMGALLVAKLIEKGFLGEKNDDEELINLLQQSVVIVGTKGNMSGKKMRKAMYDVAKVFAKKCSLQEVAYVTCDAGDWKEKDDIDETPFIVLDNLQNHLQKLKSTIDGLNRRGKMQQKGPLTYTKIEKGELVDMVCETMGIEADAAARQKMVDELGFWRNAIPGVVGLFSFDATRREKAKENLAKAWTGFLKVFAELSIGVERIISPN